MNECQKVVYYSKEIKTNQSHLDWDNTMVFYPTLTNFWIVLILKSSKDVALIRWLM